MKESKNMSACEGHQSGRRWDLLGHESLLYKLFRSRRALQAVMKRHGVGQKLLEPLFNHIVVHSMDHHGAYKSSHLRFFPPSLGYRMYHLPGLQHQHVPRHARPTQPQPAGSQHSPLYQQAVLPGPVPRTEEHRSRRCGDGDR
ncbi:uncharacterized protein LOC118417980 [Branchiostoma floridae]|uniref:Uncharacterized protein LOC118417980 n=1 Tax=Branchiostoma floridae TaxID=7739 RepID=A0A9J7LCH8_BRAFL|nr:uncharacterized protein LOC118417980 [Branchiostoma floridae]